MKMDKYIPQVQSIPQTALAVALVLRLDALAVNG
jgi:hypothetical protein